MYSIKMIYLLRIAIIISLKEVTCYTSYSSNDCGIRPVRRQPRTNNNQYFSNNNKYYRNEQYYGGRKPKIISGKPTKEGQFPWQASLELLHPSMGFLGHWCGGVLIDRNWIISAAHCIHNDLFNLPLPPLWTVVLGEYDRSIESGYEQRIPVEKIILHDSYHNFLHDLVLMKLSVPADISRKTNIRLICLPFNENIESQSIFELNNKNDDDDVQSNDFFNFNTQNNQNNDDDLNLWENAENFLRQYQGRNKEQNLTLPTLPSMKELLTTKIINRLKYSTTSSSVGSASRYQVPINQRYTKRRNNNHRNEMRMERKYPSGKIISPDATNTITLKPKRRNDKLMAGFINYDYYDNNNSNNNDNNNSNNKGTKYNAGNGMNIDLNINNEERNNFDTNNKYIDLPYIDCVATGWGKSNITGDLTNILLKTTVPLHNSLRCKNAYGNFVKIHKGHLCAGKLNGRGGTCVGDSGGPLQCRLTKNGPWILAGITSFGSGCAIEGFPDVYTRTSFYMKWIRDTIENE